MVDVKGTFPRLHVWLIANLTSGHGRGRVMLNRIEKALQKNFCKAITRTRVASDVLQHDDICPPIMDAADAGTHDEGGNNGRGSCLATATDDAVSSFVQNGSLQVDIIITEETVRGQQVANHLAERLVAARLHRGFGRATCVPAAVAPTSATATTLAAITDGRDSLHIFVSIGGDGSLSDVINGMCRGTLRAFRDVWGSQSDASICTAGSQSWSINHYWQSLEDKSILRHFLPPLIYVPAGTGCDFARLKLCCRDEVAFVAVLRGICRQFVSLPLSFFTSSTGVGNVPHHRVENTNECGAEREGSGSLHGGDGTVLFGFEVCDVDVGRVTFPCSGKDYFFINECSCGMSCDVIQKCESYKRSRLLSLAGGTVMFAAASVVSVTQIRPKPFRILLLPDAVALPSSKTLVAPHAASGLLLHTHLLVDQVALQGVERDLHQLQDLARDTALQPNEPLLRGADYYVYKKTGHPQDSLGMDSPSGNTDGVNPFYTEWGSLDASKSDEIIAALGADHAYRDWICFPSSTLVFGNGRWFGGGLQVTPHADPTDGILSVTSWKAGFLRFVSCAPSLYNGKHTNWSSTTTWDITRCIVDVDTRAFHTSSVVGEKSSEAFMMLCETDGELRERLPAVVEVGAVVSMLIPQRERE